MVYQGFYELSDSKWRFIRPRLPSKAWTGRPRADDRKIIWAQERSLQAHEELCQETLCISRNRK